MAQAFWALLLPIGLQGGALAHMVPRPSDSDEEYDDEDAMTGVEEEGWKEEYTDWWFDFLKEKGGRGISKDTWQMVRIHPPTINLSLRADLFQTRSSIPWVTSVLRSIVVLGVCTYDRRQIREIRHGRYVLRAQSMLLHP